MSFLDSITGFLSGPIGQLGGKLLGGSLDNSSASDRQEAAQQFSAQQYATRYQTQVADMKAAGLNPMLAYTQAPGNSPGGVVSTPGNQYSSAVDSVLQSKLNSAQVANIAADTENKKAQAELIQSEVERNRASAAHLASGAQNLDASTSKILEEIKNIPTEGQRLKFVIQQLAEEAAYLAQKGETEVSIRREIHARVAKLAAESKLLGFDISASEDYNNMGRRAGQAKPVFDIVNSVMRAGKGK